jgi:2',3'-cyclic-nucleotide 2'-phosphodiesterase (5'-nucleotidase family)
MSFKHLFIFFIFLIAFNCKQNKDVFLHKIEGKRITISDSLEGDQNIEAFIKPYREHINNDLDSVIAYSVGNYSPKDGVLENAIGNFMADITYQQANPIYKKRTGKDIDLVVLNNGGIRSGISKGNLTSRIAYKIMPFENSVVVTELKGEQIKELIDYLSKAKRANPIAKLSLKLNNEDEAIEALLNGKPIDYDKTYSVGTIDYLYNGGSGMHFLKNNVGFHPLDYKLRNVIIDYLKKTDTINLTTDGRFIKIHN